MLKIFLLTCGVILLGGLLVMTLIVTQFCEAMRQMEEERGE